MSVDGICDRQQILHRQCWELLPWLLNGSLDATESQRVRQHMDECSQCAREYQSQARLQQMMQREESILYTPHAPLRKLMERIDAAEVKKNACADDAPQPLRTAMPRRRQWLAAAVVLQTLGLIAMATILSWKSAEVREAPRYSTLTSAPAVLPHGPAARVVFAPSTSLEQLDELLRTQGAQIIAGPSEAGVYTLAFPAAREPSEVSAIIVKLRSDPRVRFAEPAVTGNGAGR